jgi:hypothetical protein
MNKDDQKIYSIHYLSNQLLIISNRRSKTSGAVRSIAVVIEGEEYA